MSSSDSKEQGENKDDSDSFISKNSSPFLLFVYDVHQGSKKDGDHHIYQCLGSRVRIPCLL